MMKNVLWVFCFFAGAGLPCAFAITRPPGGCDSSLGAFSHDDKNPLREGKEEIKQAEALPDFFRIVTLDAQKTLRFWKGPEKTELIARLEKLPDGHRTAALTTDPVRNAFWALSTQGMLFRLDGNGQELTRTATNTRPREAKLQVLHDRWLVMWNNLKGGSRFFLFNDRAKQVFALSGRRPIYSADMSADGNYLSVSENARDFENPYFNQVINLRTKTRQALPEDVTRQAALSFAPTGHDLLARFYGEDVDRIDLEKNQRLRLLRGEVTAQQKTMESGFASAEHFFSVERLHQEDKKKYTQDLYGLRIWSYPEMKILRTIISPARNLNLVKGFPKLGVVGAISVEDRTSQNELPSQFLLWNTEGKFLSAREVPAGATNFEISNDFKYLLVDGRDTGGPGVHGPTLLKLSTDAQGP